MALHTFKGILLVAVCVCLSSKVNAIEQNDNCPPIDENIRCFWYNKKCESNSDCSNGQICCAHACGTDCIDPTGLNNVLRPGVCPASKPVAPDFCARAFVLSNCRQDSDCKDTTQKCCPGVCGALQCTTPLTGNRPGCPAINLDLHCIVYNQQCNSDRDCEDGRLCCYQPNCGTTCNEPEPVACLDCCGDPPCCNRCDKTGTCPVLKPGQVGTCAEECNLDIDCPGDKKCCSNGCGHVCTDPAGTSTVKDGKCPALPPGTIGACVELCSGDSSCPGSQKCCSNGCGHMCKNPAGTSTVKDGECPALPPGTIGACVELCSGDSSCPGSQKCCSNGCGHVCKDPINTNEGVMK